VGPQPNGALGAIAGGAVAAANGTAGGILGIEDCCVFVNMSYASTIPHIRYKGDVPVGRVLPR
jgi:hypothetical protein